MLTKAVYGAVARGEGRAAAQRHLADGGIHDFRGSGHITAMARTVLGLSVVQTGKTFSLNGPRRLELVKTNLGPYPNPLGVLTVVGLSYALVAWQRRQNRRHK